MQNPVLSSRAVPARALTFIAIIAIASLSVYPSTASAEHGTTGSINKSSLTTTSTQPTLKGEAEGISSVTISIYEEDSSDIVFQEEDVSVDGDDAWEVDVSEKLDVGTYDVKLSASASRTAKVLDTETLTISKTVSLTTLSVEEFNRLTRAQKITELQRQLAILINLRNEMMRANLADSSGTLTVTTVPLLSGGTITGGESIPISYLQVRNSSSESVTVLGFTVKQNGTAPTNLITNLTVSDNVGASRATSAPNPFKDGSGYVQTFATIKPGGFKIFTIKATMTSNVFAAYGKNFKLDVTNVETNGSIKASYPLRGTIWSVGY